MRNQAVTMFLDQIQCNIVVLVSVIFWNVAVCNCDVVDDAHKECEQKNSSHRHIFLDTAHRRAFSPTLALFRFGATLLRKSLHQSPAGTRFMGPHAILLVALPYQ